MRAPIVARQSILARVGPTFPRLDLVAFFVTIPRGMHYYVILECYGRQRSNII